MKNRAKGDDRSSKGRKIKIFIPGILFLVILVLGVGYWVVLKSQSNTSKSENETNPEIITKSMLEKIINVDDLSTYTAVYNGIAKVMNEKHPDEIDYYVSYNAKAYVGIDFREIAIDVNNEDKTIHVTLPNVHFQDVIVDIASMDFIFVNKKANASTVSEEAYKACSDDAREESEKQTEILELAKQNAINITKAWIRPIIEQLDSEYTLVVE